MQEIRQPHCSERHNCAVFNGGTRSIFPLKAQSISCLSKLNKINSVSAERPLVTGSRAPECFCYVVVRSAGVTGVITWHFAQMASYTTLQSYVMMGLHPLYITCLLLPSAPPKVTDSTVRRCSNIRYLYSKRHTVPLKVGADSLWGNWGLRVSLKVPTVTSLSTVGF